MQAAAQKIDAVRNCIRAILANPSDTARLQEFASLAGGMRVEAFDPAIDTAITACLRAGPEVDCTGMARLWLSNLRHAPGFDLEADITDFRPLLAERFLLGIRHIVVTNLAFESFITRLRRRVLEAGEKELARKDRTALAAALAHYAFQTDYILDVTPEEQERVNVLRAAVEADEKDTCAIALLACYAPLHTLDNAGKIEEAQALSPAIGPLVRAQVSTHAMLRQIAAEVESITPVSAGVSEQVRAQYEEFPYPRWHALGAEQARAQWDGCPKNTEVAGHLRGREISILNAGCGTGHEALCLAALHPRAHVLAVDLSRASLAWGISKAGEYGIANVAFRHGDILKLGALEERFDLISSAGVLHHMEDPAEGLRVLKGLLKPGGLITLALYSKIARRHILDAQKTARAHGHAGTTESMRAFRRRAPEILDKAAFDNLRGYIDYYNASMLRDLVFHAQEHNYDIPGLAALLEGLDLEFLGFSVPADVMGRYAREFPDDPRGLNLEHWDAFERHNPDLFIRMYDFWCRRRGEGQ